MLIDPRDTMDLQLQIDKYKINQDLVLPPPSNTVKNQKMLTHHKEK